MAELENRREMGSHFPVESEYSRCFDVLEKSQVLSNLWESPVPTLEEVKELFDRNRELVREKTSQGFTRLQLTPLCAPIPVLADRVVDKIRWHAGAGDIFQTKRDKSDPNIPIAVNWNEPVLIDPAIIQGEKDGGLVYFPQAYSKEHGGSAKADILQRKDICPIPGWSIGLIEDSAFLPQDNRISTYGGRKQLATNLLPDQYMSYMLPGKPGYEGETGWAPEDLLINVLTRLQKKSQVSHSWLDNNGLWLTGVYLPNEAADAVSACWGERSEQLSIRKNHSGSRNIHRGARTIVRLGIS